MLGHNRKAARDWMVDGMVNSASGGQSEDVVDIRLGQKGLGELVTRHDETAKTFSIK